MATKAAQPTAPADLKEIIKKPKFRESDVLSKQERAVFLQTAYKTAKTRIDQLRQLEQLRDHEVVQTILDVMIDDGFKASTTKAPLFTIEYSRESDKKDTASTNAKITQELRDTAERLGLQSLIRDMLEDFILWGEYFFRVESHPEKGIIELKDDVKTENVLGVYRKGLPGFFLRRGITQKGKEWTVKSSQEYVHFIYGMRKYRVEMTTSFQNSSRLLPEQIRIGRSLFAGAIRKLKRLQTMDAASLADDLRRILAPILVLIGVPSQTSPKDVTAIMQEYKDKLKRMDRYLGNIDFSDPSSILAMMGDIEVIPNFSDGKGGLETLDLHADGKQVDERIDRLAASIGLTIGFPTYYLSTSETPSTGKVEGLKINSRYSRKLVALQEAIADGIKSILLLDREIQGIQLRPENINITFKSIVNVDLLDTIEYQVAVVQTLRDLFDALDTMSQSETVPLEVAVEKFVQFTNELLASFPALQDVVRKREKTEEPQPDTSTRHLS